jgi:hypothetical protein
MVPFFITIRVRGIIPPWSQLCGMEKLGRICAEFIIHPTGMRDAIVIVLLSTQLDCCFGFVSFGNILFMFHD